ncbi:MAG: beta-lactamase family protein [Acidimicrobiia bacterium]|nr:beta-lactamase family protein [Acidimicrobiia bacterium]
MAAIAFPSPLPSDLVPLPSQPPEVGYPTLEWPIGSPVGADEIRLRTEINRAFAEPNEPIGGSSLGQSLALVVVQGGRIVAERYHPESASTEALVSWSMAKSFTHALLGILVHQGRFTADLGPAPVAAWADDGRAAITTAQLLEMRSGLRWVEEYEEEDDGALTDVLEMLFGTGADDMAAFAAAKPLAHPPGQHYYYSSGTTNIVSRLITEAVAEPGATIAEQEDAVRRFMEDELFGPLGMSSADPRFDRSGTFVGSSFLYATARDFARFGLLHLRDGMWDGRRILPEGWVDDARRPLSVEPDSLNWYSRHWWVYPCTHGSFRASGYEGQVIVVVPGLDLVIVRLGKTPFENGADPLFSHLAELIACFEEVSGARPTGAIP